MRGAKRLHLLQSANLIALPSCRNSAEPRPECLRAAVACEVLEQRTLLSTFLSTSDYLPPQETSTWFAGIRTTDRKWARAPAAPTELTAIAESTSAITLTWKDNASDER